MVTSLAKKFQLRIVPQSENRGRPKLELNKEEKSWLTDFLDRPDISYVTPGKLDQVYIGKNAGEKKYKTKQYLLWTLNEALDISNGCSATEVQSKEDSFVNRSQKKISYRQFYEFIKANNQYVFNKDIPHATCLCKICENAVYFMKALNQHLPKELTLPTNPHDIVEKVWCDSRNDNCMIQV